MLAASQPAHIAAHDGCTSCCERSGGGGEERCRGAVVVYWSLTAELALPCAGQHTTADAAPQTVQARAAPCCGGVWQQAPACAAAAEVRGRSEPSAAAVTDMGKHGKSALARRPLVPPPMKSMRRARAVTSSFHRLTRELADAAQEGRTADAAALAQEVEQLGGCARGCARRCWCLAATEAERVWACALLASGAPRTRRRLR
jgi:hypothetical protein